MSLVPRLPLKMHICRSSSNAPRLPSFLETLKNPHVLLTCDKVHNPLPCHAKRHLNARKWSEPVSWFTLLTSKCVRAKTASTFSTSQLPKVARTCCALYILTSKCASRHNGVHFLDISTSKSGPDLVCLVYWKFASRRNDVHFSNVSLPKVLRTWCVLYILTLKFASRHNGVHFFDISTSKNSPELRCFRIPRVNMQKKRPAI